MKIKEEDILLNNIIEDHLKNLDPYENIEKEKFDKNNGKTQSTFYTDEYYSSYDNGEYL